MKETDQAQPASVEAKPGGDLPSRKRIQRRICCGITVALVVLVVVVVAVVLAVGVFKTRDPKVTVNSMKVQSVDFNVDLAGLKVHLNATLELNISIKNPNRASFKFGNATTMVYYGGTTVGEAVIPAGKILADRTLNMTTSVSIFGDRLMSNTNLLPELRSGSLAFSTSTRISGRVNVLNVFKHHAVSYTVCNLTVSVSSRSIQSQKCVYSMKL